MREILFRAKEINRDKGEHRTKYKHGDWVYGLISRPYKDMFPTLPMEFRNENGIDGIEVDYKTVGQYTGLTDKNGKKIFEGDILQGTIVSRWNKSVIRCEVVYNKDGFISLEKTRSHDWEHKVKFAKDVEVIGNIYDSPELLKELQNG